VIGAHLLNATEWHKYEFEWLAKRVPILSCFSYLRVFWGITFGSGQLTASDRPKSLMLKSKKNWGKFTVQECSCMRQPMKSFKLIYAEASL